MCKPETKRGCGVLKYESPTSNGSKVMIKVNILKMKVKGKNIIINIIDGKVLSQGKHMWNMKAVPFTVQKLW